ncbi:sensor histidine kinase [Sphaerimonospora thailandensis]|uniref:sensor histidine kinase n=1 Tax=Sphaerimonospora thailandensis TaxID=795644 RepID=UPI001951EA0F|nr:sensor histidine kinase [Sphaerimonospora thailandensis]
MSALRRLSSLHPLVLDSSLASSLVVVTWLWDLYGPDMGRHCDLLSTALTLLANGPLALRRRAPLAVLVIITVASFAYHMLGYHVGLNTIGMMVALYTVAVHRSWKADLAGAALVVPTWTHGSALQPTVALLSALGQSLLLAACALGAGVSVRLLSRRTRQLAELAEQLRKEQDAAANRAVTRERVRIARELHDVVAHHMSVISVQAGLGRFVALSHPPTALATLEVIADTSHEALDEMRRLLSILRIEAHEEDEGLYAAAPGLKDVDTLAERIRAAGPAVDMIVEGVVRPLPPGLELSAYRIVQESLTNVLKHAGPSRVELEVTYGPATLTVRVTDDGTGAASAGRDPRSGGHGLIGMTERVRLYQGTLKAGPLPQGGFEVLAIFPLPSSGEVE